MSLKKAHRYALSTNESSPISRISYISQIDHIWVCDYMKLVEQSLSEICYSAKESRKKNVLSSQSGKQTSTCTRISGPSTGLQPLPIRRGWAPLRIQPTHHSLPGCASCPAYPILHWCVDMSAVCAAPGIVSPARKCWGWSSAWTRLYPSCEETDHMQRNS